VQGENLFVQDTLPCFANKNENQKITLKKWRTWFSIVLSTRFHLKLMRAVSSL